MTFFTFLRFTKQLSDYEKYASRSIIAHNAFSFHLFVFLLFRSELDCLG